MQLHDFAFRGELHKPEWWFVGSDLHIESPNFDRPRFIRDMEAALRVNASILLNGDILDGILPGDKRWRPTCVRAGLHDREDILKAVTDYAFTLLKPYAHRIRIIGQGNHEEAWSKWCKIDPIGVLVEKLNDDLEKRKIRHVIRHGSIGGGITSRFYMRKTRGSGGTLSHRLLYMHGSGGDSPVTKGTIDAYRKGTNWEFDAITLGHRHNRLAIIDEVIGWQLKKLTCATRVAMLTGSYVCNWALTTQDNPLAYNYAESKTHTPKPRGGWFLALIPSYTTDHSPSDAEKANSHKNGRLVIRQEICTYPIPAQI